MMGLFLMMLPLIPAASQEMEDALSSLLSDDCLENAGIGVYLLDLESGNVLAEHQAQLPLPPASTLKVLTTIQALEILGEHFQTHTVFGYRGKLSGDTLHGDLIIRGAGDPTLGSPRHDYPFRSLLEHWTTKVIQQNIRYVTGAVVSDASYCSIADGANSWPYEDLGNYYGAVACGLNIHDNEYEVRLRQELVEGSAIQIESIRPQVPGLDLISYVLAGPRHSGDQAYIIGAPLQNNRYIRGTIPVGNGSFVIRGSLPDPPYFLARHVKDVLRQSGIVVDGDAISVYESTGEIEVLDEMPSSSVQSIIKWVNHQSVNLYAEGLGLWIEKMGAPRTASLIEYFEARGIELGGCRSVDYCGLAPDNALHAKGLVEILAYAHDKPDLFQLVRTSLPVVGEAGTVRSMLRSSPARGSIYAKSGQISGVRNYVGYIKSKQDHWLAFAILTQNPQCGSQVVRRKLALLLESMYLNAP